MRIIRYIDVHPWATAQPDSLNIATESQLTSLATNSRRYRITIDIPEPEVDGEITAEVEDVPDGQTQDG